MRDISHVVEIHLYVYSSAHLEGSDQHTGNKNASTPLG